MSLFGKGKSAPKVADHMDLNSVFEILMTEHGVRHPKYPFLQMEVGDSFRVKQPDGLDAKGRVAIRATIQKAAKRMGIRTSQIDEGGGYKRIVVLGDYEETRKA